MKEDYKCSGEDKRAGQIVSPSQRWVKYIKVEENSEDYLCITSEQHSGCLLPSVGKVENGLSEG